MGNMPSLYEIATEYRASADKLLDSGLPDEVIADTLEGLDGDLQAKAQNTAMVVRNLEGLVLAIKDAEARMYERRKAAENRIAAIKHYILRSMQAGGVSKIETPHMRIAVRKNPQHVEIDAGSQIPGEFWRIPDAPPAEIDKAAIKKALSAGIEVPGAHLAQDERLEIK